MRMTHAVVVDGVRLSDVLGTYAVLAAVMGWLVAVAGGVLHRGTMMSMVSGTSLASPQPCCQQRQHYCAL